ncbi:MAG TPA: hypothetical protein VEX38_04330, partial [Fimbriimonadaceae bacterium]|nr:hypothetical protein [Fimbriimonadaceae bacterium]
KAVSSLTFSQDGALLALKAESHPKFSPDPPNAHRIRETRWPVTEKDGVRIEARFVTPEGVRLSAGTAALELSSNALHEEWPYLTYSPLQGAEHGFISLVCGRAKFPYGVYLLRGNALTELAVSMRPVTSATPRHGLFYSYNQDRWTLRDPDARSASTWRSPLLPFWMPGTSLVLLSYPGGPNATVVDLGKA